MEESRTQDTGSKKHRLQVQGKIASEQLKKDKAKIKIIWEKQIRDQVQNAEEQTSLALQNTVDLFLDELGVALERSTIKYAYEVAHKGMTKVHGEQRANFAGYLLPQLLQEFSILREVLLDDLRSANVLSYQSVLIINKAIDWSISLAATEFTAVQQAAIKFALAKAEASNKDLEHFAAVAAHDLKSPLATISSYLELLSEEAHENLNEDSREIISVMQSASLRMRNLVDRLLDYARLVKVERPFESVDMNLVMKSVLQNLHHVIHDTHAKITYGPLPIVTGDVDLLAQVFQNLIANSIKFRGEEDPRIHIECVSHHGEFLFSLRDNGIGFDPKEKEEIFILYRKLQGEAHQHGAGIGLATCKKVVELHGGQIWAESKPGEGALFYFTLPDVSMSSEKKE
jgi:Bacteriophytochrome (light-regulated signal transduction histidine kinase)